MSSPVGVAHAEDSSQEKNRPSTVGHKRIWLITASIAALVVIGGAVLCAKFWPFTQRTVVQNLAEASDSTVTVRGFKPTYFPSPGCILEGVEFRHGEQQFQFIAIDKLTIKGSFSGILTRHIQRIIVEGAHVYIPPFGSKPKFNFQHSAIAVDEIDANGAEVEFASSQSARESLRFDIHEASLTGVKWARPLAYRLKFHNPNPPGEIAVAGKVGGWVEGNPGNTPFSGDFTFDDADLGVYGGIAGTLAAQGKFDGALQHVDVSGTTDVPDFKVESGGHKVHLRTQFDAYVNGTNGDTFLKRVESRFNRTTVVAEGSIAKSPGTKGKLTNLHLAARNGRLDDLLGLFVTAPRSPMSGVVSLDAHATFQPGDQSFLDKLRLTGTFGVGSGDFTSPETQKDVDALSAGALGKNKEDPETVVTDLKGSVDLTRGTAQFSNLTFGVPGADAQMHGTYNVINHKVDLHGNMRVATQISKTTTGMKALLLKAMDPFFHKRNKGEVVPVHILGTYEKPEFGLDLSKPGDKASPAKGNH